jgi:hypothetical protein
MNARQARVDQIDAWRDRHGVHAYKTVPMADQTNQALYRDHAEALEMNANGDAGRAAFLGENDPGPVPPMTDHDHAVLLRVRVIAAIHAMAQWLLDHPDAPTPVSIRMIARAGEIHNTTDAERVAVLDEFHSMHPDSDRYTLPGNGRCQHEYAKVHLGGQESHGAELTYTVSTTTHPGMQSWDGK